MNSPPSIIKCRALLGGLKSYGVEASRRSFCHQPHGGPDALLVAADGRAWLTVIWPGSTVQSQLGLDEEADKVPGLDATVQQLTEWCAQHDPAPGELRPQLLIIAPGLDRAELPLGYWPFGAESIPVIPRQACGKNEPLAKAILSLIGPVLSQAIIDSWRAVAIPEVKIETPRRRLTSVRDHRSVVAPLLLDYRQERCARLDLEQDADAKAISTDLNVRVVTGVAGCGKTLVLVHRAALLAAHFPTQRVLVVSHNKPLIRDLERRVKRFKAAGRIECRTFYSWLARLAPTPGEMLKPYEVTRWMARERRVLDPEGVMKRFPENWLIEEMGWMFDHEHADEGYLTVERKGRGIPLVLKQRQVMLALAQKFRAHLRQENECDWSEWPLHVAQQQLPVFRQPQFDHLLIDEAQFFAPVWLRLLTSVLKPGGHLFLCADPTQGFLRRRTSWTEIGLDVRNRSYRLERPYRSTRAILEFARDFYQRRLPNDDEPLNLPAPEWMETIEPGMPPRLLPAGSPQDQITRLIHELGALRAQGTPLNDVLILVAGHNAFERELVSQINRRLGADTAASMKDSDAPEQSAGVAHLMAATGLERPIVFLLGLDQLAEEENDATLSDEVRAEKRLDHTRQIYVGLTRAMERLFLYTDRLWADFGLAKEGVRSA